MTTTRIIVALMPFAWAAISYGMMAEDKRRWPRLQATYVDNIVMGFTFTLVLAVSARGFLYIVFGM